MLPTYLQLVVSAVLRLWIINAPINGKASVKTIGTAFHPTCCHLYHALIIVAVTVTRTIAITIIGLGLAATS